jgi:capsular exopolysaccharide synthesis family protein
VQSATNTDCLGFLPVLRRFSREDAADRLSGDRLDQSRFGEELRSIYARLRISAEAGPKVIMFASALPQEGKTTCSAAFALMMARSGRRTVIVDCDTRRPQVHTAFGQPRDFGLTDFLHGRSLDEVTHPIGQDARLDMIPAGAEERYQADLFALGRMQLLLATLEAKYDLVILDSPPVIAVPDALILAPLVGKVVFLVQWGKTPQAAATRAIQLLRDAGADVAGSVMTMVDFAEMAATDPSASYYRKVQRYLKAA